MGKVDRSLFDAFYREKAPALVATCEQNPRAHEAIRAVRESGALAVLATNPMFPEIFTRQRAERAGLPMDELTLITTYENSCHCKPNPAYYTEILNKLGLQPEECVMIGNDAGEDLPASLVGMDVFLLTDSLINRNAVPLSDIPHGSYDELYTWLGLQ